MRNLRSYSTLAVTRLASRVISPASAPTSSSRPSIRHDPDHQVGSSCVDYTSILGLRTAFKHQPIFDTISNRNS